MGWRHFSFKYRLPCALVHAAPGNRVLHTGSRFAVLCTLCSEGCAAGQSAAAAGTVRHCLACLSALRTGLTCKAQAVHQLAISTGPPLARARWYAGRARIRARYACRCGAAADWLAREVSASTAKLI